MKDYINEIDSRDAIMEGESISSPERNASDFTIQFRIEKFPSEFKKKILKRIDKTFLVILLSSVLLNISTLLILKKIIPPYFDSSTINRIQEQYAKLLLKGGTTTTTYSFDVTNSDFNKVDSKVLTGLSKWMDVYTSNIIETIKNIPALNEPVTGVGSVTEVKEASLPSREELTEARKSGRLTRGVSQSELEKEVGSVGLLGLISRDAKAADREYVEDLLEYASENSSQLAKVLAKLNTIEVPRYGSSGYLRKIRKSTDAEDASDLKGGRVTTDEDTRNVIENIAPINQATSTAVDRNVQFEEVPSSYVENLPELSINRKTRSAQDVVSVVQSHSRALQDCYKQELKYDPTIKGKISVRFTLNPDGIVTGASLVTSTLNSPRMESCILNRIKGWRNFPPCDASEGEKTYRQSFSFGEKN